MPPKRKAPMSGIVGLLSFGPAGMRPAPGRCGRDAARTPERAENGTPWSAAVQNRSMAATDKLSGRFVRMSHWTLPTYHVYLVMQGTN